MLQSYDGLPNFLLKDNKAFRNALGMLVLNSEQVFISGGTFSDNRGNIDIHRSEGVQVTNTRIVGKSKDIELLEVTQKGPSTSLCPNRQTILTAIDIHSFTRSRQGNGVIIDGIDISGFTDINKCKEYAFRIDPEVSTEQIPSIFT